MKKRTCKTLRGIVKRYRHRFWNLSVRDILSREGIFNDHYENFGTKKERYVKERLFLSEELRRELAEIFAQIVYKSYIARNQCVEFLCQDSIEELDCFQCFYFHCIENGKPTWVGNSLSGEAYDYCKRKFLRANR